MQTKIIHQKLLEIEQNLKSEPNNDPPQKQKDYYHTLKSQSHFILILIAHHIFTSSHAMPTNITKTPPHYT